MADPTIKIRVKADTGDADKKLGGLRNTLGGLRGVAATAAKALGAIAVASGGVAIAAGTAIGRLAVEAAKVDQVRDTFYNLAESIGAAADALLVDLRKATRGMVSDADLMLAANKFISMGLANSQEEAAQLAEMATQLGMAMGVDATTAMEDFALMLANQSIPRLDTFGISSGRVRDRILELMEANEDMTRETAFMTAVMEIGSEVMGKVGEQGEGAAGAMGRLGAAWANLKDTLGRVFLPILADVVEALASLVTTYGPKLKTFAENVGAWFSAAVAGVGEIVAAIKSWFEMTLPKIMTWVEETIPKIKGLFDLGITAEDLGISVEDVDASDIEAALETYRETIVGLNADLAKEIASGLGEALGAWATFNQELTTGTSTTFPLVADTVKTSMEAIRGHVETALTAIEGFWSAHGATIQATAETFWAPVETTIEIALTAVQGIIGSMMDAIAGDWDNAWFGLDKTLETAWNDIKTAVETGVAEVSGLFSDLAGNISGAFTGMDWAGIGRGIINGIKSGILGAIDGLVETARQAAQEAWDAIAGLFQPGSPYKLMVGLGEGLMESLALGIEQGTGYAVKAMQGAGAATYAAGSHTTTTHHNYNLSIHTSAPAESALSDFHIMRALAGV